MRQRGGRTGEHVRHEPHDGGRSHEPEDGEEGEAVEDEDDGEVVSASADRLGGVPGEAECLSEDTGLEASSDQGEHEAELDGGGRAHVEGDTGGRHVVEGRGASGRGIRGRSGGGPEKRIADCSWGIYAGEADIVSREEATKAKMLATAIDRLG